MKNQKSKLLSLLLVVLFVFALFGCGRRQNGDPTQSGGTPERVDVAKTQLYIGCWDGGLRSDWLYAWKNRFEELHKDTVFQEGKKGVQVWVNMSKNYALEGAASTIKNLVADEDDEVIITEQCSYYSLKNVSMDLSDAISTPLSEYGETKSILDKMNAGDKDYLGISEDGKTSYYALPWYVSFFGLNYDIDLFEEKCFYFGTDDATYKDYIDDDGFILDMEVPKSAGPDGVKGTSDDGLPATYDEFFALCDKMVENGVVPICWTGAVKDYLNHFTTALANDAMGYDDAVLQYEMNGGNTSKIVRSVNADGSLVLDSPVSITSENGYKMLRNSGRYYALQFMDRLINTKNIDGSKKYYDESKCFSNAETHITAQARFLRSKPNSEKGNGKAIAMIAEGSWWYNEATPTFNELSSSGYGEKDRRIGFMPMPKPDASECGNAVYTNTWNTGIVIRSNLKAAKVKVAKQFLRYIHTDEALSTFVVNANCIRPYDFEMKDADKSNSSYFVKNLSDIYKNADIVNPWSKNTLVLAQGSYFLYDTWNTSSGNVVVDVLRSKLNGKQYFDALSQYMNETMWNQMFGKYFN